MLSISRRKTFCLPVCYAKISILNIQKHNFAVFFYGCETSSLTLTDERRLREFENSVLRVLFGTKMDEVTDKLRKLRNEELNDLYIAHKIFLVI